MFGLLKFIWLVFKSFRNLLNVDRNELKSIPTPSKYLAMIMLSTFWCLAFGLYFGEQLFIGYNMLGHVAIVTMAFVTWWMFKSIRTTSTPLIILPHEFSLIREKNDTN